MNGVKALPLPLLPRAIPLLLPASPLLPRARSRHSLLQRARLPKTTQRRAFLQITMKMTRIGTGRN